MIRKFERLGVIQQDPQDYVARYGPSLLDSATLVQKARNAGIIEDIVSYLKNYSETGIETYTISFSHLM